MITIEDIRNSFTLIPEQLAPDDHRAPTAVALLLRKEREGLSVFFIERAIDVRDPWSGNIGFPGGRMGSGDSSLRDTAERETLEEVGITLAGASFIGRLPDIVGAHLPVRVTCFVYMLNSIDPLTLNAEVNDAFWVPLSILADPDRHFSAQVGFAGDTLSAPAIRLPHADKQVLWGITYRLIRQFITIVSGKAVLTEAQGSAR